MTTLAAKKDWCLDFFDDLFAEHCLMTRTPAQVEANVTFLKDALHLNTGDMVFDQCCGVGTLSLALAKAGYRTHGMDLIPSYIAQARREAAISHAACHFAAGDAYSYATPYPCDAAFNWWTSFGYTADDTQNAKMLVSAARSLKTGGWFALDYMNAAERRRQLEKDGEVVWRQQKPDCTITCVSRLAGDMLVKDWAYEGTDGRRVVKPGGGAKLYTPEQMEILLETAGFTDVRFFGGSDGSAFTDTSPRMIAVARKGA